MDQKAKKIIFSLLFAFIIVIFLTKDLFITNTHYLNKKLIITTAYNIIKLIQKKSPSPTPTPTQIPINFSISPTVSKKPIISSLTKKITPTKNPAKIPTRIPINSPALTLPPTLTPTPLPKTSLTCPTKSDQNYTTIRPHRSPSDGLIGNPATSPEINLRLRGFVEVNEGTGFISRHGDTYGLDDKMPPQISTLFGGPRPKIIKTYRIYEWDFEKGKSAAPQTATPNFKVHMIGLQAIPGQKLVGLQAGRQIDTEGHVFLVIYANKNDIVFTHSNSDTLGGGYLYYFLDICVDPNLLALYNKNNAEGRQELPVIAPGQIFGYTGNSDVKVVIRDSMSFMDTRYNEDWWDYGK